MLKTMQVLSIPYKFLLPHTDEIAYFSKPRDTRFFYDLPLHLHPSIIFVC